MKWKEINLSAFIQKGQWRQQLVNWAKHRDQWIHHLESLNPEWVKPALSFASEAIDPGLVGRSFRVKQWQDERIWVVLLDRWNNKNHRGEVSLGTVASLAEFILSLYWGRYIDATGQGLKVLSVNVQVDQPLRVETWLRFELKSAEREQLLFELRKQGELRKTLTISILNSGEMQVGEVELSLGFKTPKALASGAND